MRRILISIALCAMTLLPVPAANPKADPAAQVVCGNARFTVLTDRLIRMEWAEDGRFEDNATLGIINRELPVPAFGIENGRTVVNLPERSVNQLQRVEISF